MLKSLLKSSDAVDIDRPIPAIESVSESYRLLLERRDALVAEDHILDAESVALRRELAEGEKAQLKDDRVAALVAGVTYVTPAPVQERLGNIERKKRLIQAALSEIAGRLRGEHSSASRLVAAEFSPDQAALAREFYGHLVKAIEVHSKFGHLKQRLERAGIDSGSLHDFGREILGSPSNSTDHAAYALRDGVKRGYVAAADCPVGYGVQ